MRRYNLIVVYDQNEQKLLMCKRKKEPYKDLLNFVGGKIESGETDEEAAYRESFEETGISSDDILEAQSPAIPRLKRSRCRSSQEVNDSPTPFSALNYC